MYRQPIAKHFLTQLDRAENAISRARIMSINAEK